MQRFVEIGVNVPGVSGVFHYHLPDGLVGRVHAGQLVEVPFGKRLVQGVVIREIDRPQVRDTRPVAGILDPQVVLTTHQLALADWLAQATLNPLADCIAMMLPPGLSQQADTEYALHKYPLQVGTRPLSALQTRLVELLAQRGPLRGRQIDQALPRVNWRASAQALTRREIIAAHAVLPPPTVGAKRVRTVQLIASLQVAEQSMDDLGRQGTKALQRRQAMLRYLLREPGPVDVSWVYAESGGNLADLRLLAEKGLVTLGESEVWRDPLDNIEITLTEPPALTREQQLCLDEILGGLAEAASGQTPPPYLLHGVTGSGKTEVYLRAVEAVLKAGKRALVLQPEIALTPQAVRRFMARFPGQVGLIHSRLSAGERYDTWRRARSGELDVIVGPRSALFTPLPDIGLIVLDESHDDSYYQSDPPFYHARRAAIHYARVCGAVCLMGSATPDVTSTYFAAHRRWRYLRLPARIMAHRLVVQSQAERYGWTPRYRPLEGQADTIELPPVEVIDMRHELKAGNRSIFSRMLQAELGRVLKQNQQAILFLNRRGTATYVFCRDCGYVMRCPNCDLPLTYHGSRNELNCHYCAYRRGVPKTCPACKGTRIRHYGTGTERVEQEVHDLFPGARTLRWDYETTRKKGAHDEILSHFHAHRADILVGTQMLAKGLDLPLVTLVGVVLADVGLNLPDFSAPERAFQVLTQVAGRAGRSPLGGQVILQTFEPEHYVIQAAREHSYRAFYDKELEYRRDIGYPPFASLVRLEYRHLDEGQAESAALKMAQDVRTWIENEGRQKTEIIGPAPPFFARLGGYYRRQIVLRGPDPAGLLRGRRLSDWRIEVNPPSLL